MFDEELTRRKAMTRILKTVALATGLSLTDLTLLLKSAHADTPAVIKALQFKLGGYTREVFESVYGRSTPLKPRAEVTTGQVQGGVRPETNYEINQGMSAGRIHDQQLRPGDLMDPSQGIQGGMECTVQFANEIGAGCPALGGCGSYGGGSCPQLDSCTENVCSGQDRTGGCLGMDCDTNDCNGQSCGDLQSCGDNECADQNCGKLSDCDNHKPMILGDILGQYRADPYVQDLMRHFGTTNTQQLSNQVSTMLQQRRSLTPEQLRQPVGIQKPAGQAPVQPQQTTPPPQNQWWPK